MKKYWIALLIFSSIFMGCEPENDLLINGQEKLAYDLPCGNVCLSSGIAGGEYFMVAVDYNLTLTVLIDFNKITVTVNDKEIPFVLKTKSNVSGFWPETAVALEGEDFILLTFQRPLKVGDVIRVKTEEGAIICNERPLLVPDLVIPIDRIDADPSPWED